MERAWNTIRYGIDQIAMVDKYVMAMDIPFLLDLQCHGLDTVDPRKRIDRG